MEKKQFIKIGVSVVLLIAAVAIGLMTTKKNPDTDLQSSETIDSNAFLNGRSGGQGTGASEEEARTQNPDGSTKR